MNLMGLDLSLTSTGLCINEESFVIKPKPKGAERLSIVSDLILETAFAKNIQLVLIEGYAFGARNSQSHSIGELGGAVRMKLWESKIPFIDIPPTCRAKFATGKGNAGKNEVISSISAKTGIVWSGGGADDMCDAWILEQMGIAKIGLSKYAWNNQQLSALEKVDWSPLEGLIAEI
jgi:Holliday junction resolvasome RuvABC endonuclease subunit